MSQSPDRRLPCGVKSNDPVSMTWLGGCYNHLDDTIEHIKIKRNVTMMKDYASGSDYKPQGIDPYAFAEQWTAPDCSPYNEGGCPDNPCYQCGETGGDGNGNIPCGRPDPTDILSCGGSPTQSFSTGLGPYHNCYVQTDETKSFDSCRNVGFKNAYAYKTWFGRWSYTSRMFGAQDVFDPCGTGCGYHGLDSSPDTTKYLALSANSTWTRHAQGWCTNTSDGGTYTCPPDPTEWYNCCTSRGAKYQDQTEGGSANNAVHVDRYSGNFIVDSCGSSSYTWTDVAPSCDDSGCTGDCCHTGCQYNCCCCVCEPTLTGGGSRSEADIWNALVNNANYAFALLGSANYDLTHVAAVWSAHYSFDCAHGIDYELTGGGSSWTFTQIVTRTCYSGPCDTVGYSETLHPIVMHINTSGHVDVTLTGESVRNQYGCPADSSGCTPYDAVTHITWDFSGTSMHYHMDYVGGSSRSLNDDGDEDVYGTLSSPYTAEEVYQDCVGLLGHLPLDRDDLLPWRTDGNVNMGPLCHYDESGGGISPFVGTCQSQTSSLASGTIFGIPGPAGLDHVFNPLHESYCFCDSLVQPGCRTFYLKDRGHWNDAIGGGSATEWLTARQATCFPQGAFVSNWLYEPVIAGECNSGGSSGKRPTATLWMCKYAEIIFPKPSYNYARPCGEDRFTPSSGSSTQWCFTGSYDNTLVLEQYGPDTSTINTGEYVNVCGTADLDGIWTVTVAGPYELILNEPRVISASLIATSSWVDCGSGIVSKLLWQNGHTDPNGLLPAAICGRIDITSISSTSGSITCSLADDAYLVDGDQVIISDAKGGNINGNWHVTVMSPRTIGLLGSTFNPSSSYTGHGLMRSPFAADWKWNDTATKNDYTTITWSMNFRDVYEYLRLKQIAEENASKQRCATSCGDYPDYGSCGAIPPVPAIPRSSSWVCYDPTIESVECKTSCLPFNSCAPSVCFFSPNDEQFKNSGSAIQSAKNHGFGHPTIDEQYGTWWHGVVKQTMGDPIYMPPPCPCEGVYNEDTGETHYGCDCGWSEDNGTCQGDEFIPCIKYYPQRDQFEARCEVPENAPPVPVVPYGTKLGCAKVSEINCSDDAQSRCYAPYSCGECVYSYCGDTCDCFAVWAYATPWIDYLNRMNCVCGGGRFAINYENNGIVCDENWFAPPP